MRQNKEVYKSHELKLNRTFLTDFQFQTSLSVKAGKLQLLDLQELLSKLPITYIFRRYLLQQTSQLKHKSSAHPHLWHPNI